MVLEFLIKAEKATPEILSLKFSGLDIFAILKFYSWNFQGWIFLQPLMACTPVDIEGDATWISPVHNVISKKVIWRELLNIAQNASVLTNLGAIWCRIFKPFIVFLKATNVIEKWLNSTEISNKLLKLSEML